MTQKTQMKDPFTSLHKIKANLPHWAEFEILRNGALHVSVIISPIDTYFKLRKILFFLRLKHDIVRSNNFIFLYIFSTCVFLYKHI